MTLFHSNFLLLFFILLIVTSYYFNIFDNIQLFIIIIITILYNFKYHCIEHDYNFNVVRTLASFNLVMYVAVIIITILF